MPGNPKIWQGFVLCWFAASVLAIGIAWDAAQPALIAFTAPVIIAGVIRLVEGILGNGGKWNGKGKDESSGSDS